jgi:hypothetical protein
VAETTDEQGAFTCERCGAVRPAGWTCGCGGKGQGQEPPRLEGFDPETTRSPRPRLKLVQRPE